MDVTESAMVTLFTALFSTPHCSHELDCIVAAPSGMLKCPSALIMAAAAIVRPQPIRCECYYTPSNGCRCTSSRLLFLLRKAKRMGFAKKKEERLSEKRRNISSFSLAPLVACFACTSTRCWVGCQQSQLAIAATSSQEEAARH